MNEKSLQEQTRAAILIGSAPEGQIQPKLKEMKNFLQSDQGGSYTKEESCKSNKITLIKIDIINIMV